MWYKDKWFYSIGSLKAIAEWYSGVYDYPVTNSIIELKADFDRALDSIGRGEWNGLESSKFTSYKYFSKRQRVVIADILGIHDLESYGFYDVYVLRHRAYKAMTEILNRGNSEESVRFQNVHE